MTEIESKDPEIESDSVPDDEVNKENVIPVVTIGDEEKTTVSDPPEVSEEEKDVIVSASKSDSKSKTIPKKVNIDDLTEQKLYIDIQQLIETNILDPETSSKTLSDDPFYIFWYSPFCQWYYWLVDNHCEHMIWNQMTGHFVKH